MEKRFNIRAYGVLINENNEVLVSDEFRFGQRFTKFPGGGLEWGEGLEDCLLREYLEETGKKIKVKSHFYTTGFFQQSAFNEKDQLISVYYLVELLEDSEMEVSTKQFDFKLEEGAQSLRWIPLDKISENDMTFPVDKLVVGMLLKNKQSKLL